MENEETEIKRNYENECMCCFVTFYAPTEEFMCDICKDHPAWIQPENRASRINRIVSVTKSASMHHFPKTISMIWEHIRSLEKLLHELNGKIAQ